MTRAGSLRVVAASAAAALIAGGAGPRPAAAWELTTHVGLAEQGALAAGLDRRLRALGWGGGLYEPLTIPPDDAPDLMTALAQHSPVHGYVPDTRGRQYALGWLLAGAALADASEAWAADHFFDPGTGAGWLPAHRSLIDRARGLPPMPGRGVPAPDWVTSPDNPFGLGGFLDQYEKAVRTATPGERARHLAGALIAAGAMLHVLADMASPSRVRGDAAAHDQQVGPDPRDRGSRFERLTALAWGRLGVPAAEGRASSPTLRGFFTGEQGLAEWTAAHYFSDGTLPRPVEVGSTPRERLAAVLTGSLTRPAPTVPRRLNLMAASQPQGATLRDADGVCLARYHVNHGRLSWSLDDPCRLEQARAILPIAARYQAGLLDWLLRGELAVTAKGRRAKIAARGDLGAGQLTVLSEDGRGVRTPIGDGVELTAATADGAAVTEAVVPADGVRVVALFRGVDGAGQPLIAVGIADVVP